MHFYGLISKLVALLIKEEMHRNNIFSCFKTKSEKQNTTLGLFISAMCHVKLDRGDTRLYMPQKHEISGFFTVFRKFSRKILQKTF